MRPLLALWVYLEVTAFRGRRRRRRSTVPADAGRGVPDPTTRQRCNCTRCQYGTDALLSDMYRDPAHPLRRAVESSRG